MNFAKIRRTLFVVHMWIGLVLGVLLAVLGISGSILVYDDAIADLLAPPPHAEAQGSPLPLDAVIAAARSCHVERGAVTVTPGGRVSRRWFVSGRRHAAMVRNPVAGRGNAAAARDAAGRDGGGRRGQSRHPGLCRSGEWQGIGHAPMGLPPDAGLRAPAARQFPDGSRRPGFCRLAGRGDADPGCFGSGVVVAQARPVEICLPGAPHRQRIALSSRTARHGRHLDLRRLHDRELFRRRHCVSRNSACHGRASSLRPRPHSPCATGRP